MVSVDNAVAHQWDCNVVNGVKRHRKKDCMIYKVLLGAERRSKEGKVLVHYILEMYFYAQMPNANYTSRIPSLTTLYTFETSMLSYLLTKSPVEQ